MKKIIEALNGKITAETHLDMTKEQECYVAGLADALEIVKSLSEEQCVVGRTYYALTLDRFSTVQ